MNNLAYVGQDQQTIAPKVQELLGKELAAAGPIRYKIESEGAAGVSAASVLKDLGSSIFGGKVALLFTIQFEIVQPRSARLEVHMIRKGLGCTVGSLGYATVLSKRIVGDVSLGDDGKFTGDLELAGRLNAKKDILKKCDRFAMKEGGLTGSEIKIQRTLKIISHQDGAQIVAVTLPRSKSMGFSASLGSKEFLEIVTLLEATM
jgi:hypothetical protein